MKLAYKGKPSRVTADWMETLKSKESLEQHISRPLKTRLIYSAKLSATLQEENNENQRLN